MTWLTHVGVVVIRSELRRSRRTRIRADWPPVIDPEDIASAAREPNRVKELFSIVTPLMENKSTTDPHNGHSQYARR